MKIVFLGTAGYHPNEKRQTTSILIPELGFALDAGTGFFRARDYLETDHLHIFLSHAHLDHSVGLTYLLDVLYQKFPPEKVTLIGLKKYLEAVKEHLFNEQLFSVPPKFKTRPLDGEKQNASINGVKVSWRENDHPGTSVSYRFVFPDSKILAYCTDLTAGAELGEFVKNADLLIHECYFPDAYKEQAKKTGHSWTSAVHELALKNGVKKIAFMHFNPLDESGDPARLREAEIPFANSIVTRDRMEVEL